MNSAAVLNFHRQVFLCSTETIKWFYGILFFLQFNSLTTVTARLQEGLNFIPALFYLSLLPSEVVVALINLGPFITLFAFFNPHLQSARFCSALVVLTHYGLMASSGHRLSSSVVLIWMAMTFVLAPNWKSAKRTVNRHQALFTVWLATLTLLLTYWMSGLWKLTHSLILPLIQGEAGFFDFQYFSRMTAYYTIRTETPGWLSGWVIDHPVLSWSMFPLGALLELGAPLILFIPRYLPHLGFALLTFHLFSIYILHIAFALHIPMILLFLCLSPLKEVPLTWFLPKILRRTLCR